jgi:hypothetical protein
MTVNGVGRGSLNLGVFLSGAAVALMLAGASPAHAVMGADPRVVAKVFTTKGPGSNAFLLCALNGTGCGGFGAVTPTAWSGTRLFRAGGTLERDFQATTGIISVAITSYGSTSSSDDHVCAMLNGQHWCARVFSFTGTRPSAGTCHNIDVQVDTTSQCDTLASETGVDRDALAYLVKWSQVSRTENATVITCQDNVGAQCLPDASLPQMTKALETHQGGGYDRTGWPGGVITY